MASAWQGNGSNNASPFISQYVDILSENILIIPDSSFTRTYFKITYNITVTKAGVRIPLLFYASEFSSDFKVYVDGQEVKLTKTPIAYKKLEGTPAADFDYLFETGYHGEKKVVIWEQPSSGFVVTLRDLKFFETTFH